MSTNIWWCQSCRWKGTAILQLPVQSQLLFKMYLNRSSIFKGISVYFYKLLWAKITVLSKSLPSTSVCQYPEMTFDVKNVFAFPRESIHSSVKSTQKIFHAVAGFNRQYLTQKQRLPFFWEQIQWTRLIELLQALRQPPSPFWQLRNVHFSIVWGLYKRCLV